MNPQQAIASRKVLEENRQSGPGIYECDDLSFETAPNVFSPSLFADSALFARRLAKEEMKGKRLLEIGCGVGIASIYLIKKCSLKSACAVDINSAAVECTRRNAIRLGVATQIRVSQGDVYNGLPPRQRYDVIYWNHPWTPLPAGYKYRDALERSVFDRGYEGLYKYIGGSVKRLNVGGRIFLGFGDFGDRKTLAHMTRAFGYRLHEMINVAGTEGSQKEIRYILYELKRNRSQRSRFLQGAHLS